MQRAAKLAPAAYLVAILLIVFPVFDVLAAAWPIRVGLVNWRYGAVGLASRVLITPLLGLLLGCLIALLLEHRRTLRGLAVLNAVAATLLVGIIALFMLDAVQLRAQAAAEIRPGLDAASVIVLVKYGLTAFATAALGYGAWRASSAVSRSRHAAPAHRRGATLIPKRPDKRASDSPGVKPAKEVTT